MKICRAGFRWRESAVPSRFVSCFLSGRARLQSHAARRYTSVSAAELQFGQPLHETHPHLLKAGECETRLLKAFLNEQTLTGHLTVTPGITAAEYAQRRSKLASKLSKNAVAIVAASDIKYRSGAVFYEFHQESNFSYLTGTVGFNDEIRQRVEVFQVSMSQKLSR